MGGKVHSVRSHSEGRTWCGRDFAAQNIATGTEVTCWQCKAAQAAYGRKRKRDRAKGSAGETGE